MRMGLTSVSSVEEAHCSSHEKRGVKMRRKSEGKTKGYLVQLGQTSGPRNEGKRREPLDPANNDSKGGN